MCAPTPSTPMAALLDQNGQPGIIHQRSALSEQVQPLESFGTRSVVLGLIRLLRRRGILGDHELQRLLNNLAETGEIDPTK